MKDFRLSRLKNLKIKIKKLSIAKIIFRKKKSEYFYDFFLHFGDTFFWKRNPDNIYAIYCQKNKSNHLFK